MCISRTDVRLEKLPMVRRTLFCRRCNLIRWGSATNSHVRQACHHRVILMSAINCSLLNREYTLINVLKALASIISVWSPCNILIEDYTEIFYIIYKWNVPSIQCKKRLRWSNSMREVDCSSLVFTDFNIPTLTPGSH
jgi:hypothetical protein